MLSDTRPNMTSKGLTAINDMFRAQQAARTPAQVAADNADNAAYSAMLARTAAQRQAQADETYAQMLRWRIEQKALGRTFN